MSFYPGKQIVNCEKDFTEEMLKIEGELDETSAKILLTKFLKQNLGLTLYLMTGVELTALQEILLRAIFKRDNGIIIAPRGGGKSFIISVLAILYPIFYFNSKMCLISANFRGSRRILEESEKIICSKRAKLVKQCFPGYKSKNIIQRAPDMYRITLGEPSNSEVFALPLSEGLRGTRATLACLDEGVLLDEKTVFEILQPFLTARLNAQEEIEIRRREDELIREGVITEKDRISFPKNKFFIFSSATYKFQYVYNVFENTIANALNPPPPKEEEKDSPTTYFACRFSYDAIEEGTYLDKTQINAAASYGGDRSDYFKREYMALFTDAADGYFNIKKLHNCTHKIGEYPTTQVIGDKNSKYIIAIDTAYSESRTEDYFAFTTHLLDENERKITQVNTYGRFGADLKSHYEYFTYLLTNFNVVFIVIDASGTEFIHSYNESVIAQEKGIKLGFMRAEFDTDDLSEYSKQLKVAKSEYNFSDKCYVYPQKFSAQNQSIRRMNEYMKGRIEAEKIWFASPCRANDKTFKKYTNINWPYGFKDNFDKTMDIAEFIDWQDQWIIETKSQISLIEVHATSSGNLQYDLPTVLRRQTGENKVRRDHYTCNLIAIWASKIYFDIMFTEEQEEQQVMTPIIIK